jgi:hypothetical protein
MNLSSNKSPCPICGGNISWLLPSKIEDEYICSTCYSKIDIQDDKASNLTMQSIREYLAFYEQNQLLKDKFVIFERIEFGIWDTIFDYHNKLFCISKNPDKTVFEGKQLKSFTIKEDNALLFEGSAAGIKRYASTVPERAMALAPQISPKPFKAFNVELHFNHPYWTVVKFDMNGPRFNSIKPDVNDYLQSYKQNIEKIEELVFALRTVAKLLPA